MSLIFNTELQELICNHEDAELEAPCCNGYDSEGILSCGCRGEYSVKCLTPNCTGIQGWEVEDLFERLGAG